MNKLPPLTTTSALKEWYDAILSGHRLDRAEAESLLEIPNETATFDLLLKLADDLRCHYLGNCIELCSIINAKSGRCSEDCKFCAQSAHYDAPAETYDLMHYEPIAEMAKTNEAAGVHRFSLVMSGRGIDEADLTKVLAHYKQLQADTKMSLCASLGLMTEVDLKRLTETGVTMYHHNLETGPRYYEEICTTHSYQDRIDTIQAAKRAGLKICSGGIIGMGETWQDRLDMVFVLRDLEVVSIPVNVLNPILGTPFAHLPRISQAEILKTIAIFRWVHPTADIRLGGGRHLIDRAGRDAFRSGASATITGDYLTTVGQDMAGDRRMFESLHLPLGLRR